MNRQSIVKAWKDSSFRSNLSEEEKSSLPANPVGERFTEISDDDLKNVTGGEAIPCEGYVSTVSGECWPGDGSCNPF